jgi:hypothetical protein
MDSPLESAVERFVRMLLITGAWLDEVALGLSAELSPGSYPGKEPWELVLEMLSGTIGTALQSAEPREVRLATELIDLAGSRVEEHLRLRFELSRRMHEPGTGDRRTYG